MALVAMDEVVVGNEGNVEMVTLVIGGLVTLSDSVSPGVNSTFGEDVIFRVKYGVISSPIEEVNSGVVKYMEAVADDTGKEAVECILDKAGFEV